MCYPLHWKVDQNDNSKLEVNECLYDESEIIYTVSIVLWLKLLHIMSIIYTYAHLRLIQCEIIV